MAEKFSALLRERANKTTMQADGQSMDLSECDDDEDDSDVDSVRSDEKRRAKKVFDHLVDDQRERIMREMG